MTFLASRTHVNQPPKSANEPEKDRACKQFTTIGKMLNIVSSKSFAGPNKVSVIGLDDVGIATVFTLLSKGVTDNICMVEMNDDILQSEQMDLQSSAIFLNNPYITASKDPAETYGSKVCILTTGTYKGRDEDDPQYVSRNAGIIKALIQPLAKHSPDAIFIVASDPVDVLSYVTWRLSGFPKSRIIGTGTLLDTARFRYLLADKFGVSPSCCNAHIIGEHGPNSVPVWSNVNIAGVRLQDINPQAGLEKDPEMWHELYTDTIKGNNRVKHLKGNMSWSIALAIADICAAIFTNSNNVIPVSTYVKGEHSLREDIFLSLPCVIGRSGVTDILRQTLNDTESTRLRMGAEHVAQLQESTNKILG